MGPDNLLRSLPSAKFSKGPTLLFTTRPHHVPISYPFLPNMSWLERAEKDGRNCRLQLSSYLHQLKRAGPYRDHQSRSCTSGQSTEGLMRNSWFGKEGMANERFFGLIVYRETGSPYDGDLSDPHHPPKKRTKNKEQKSIDRMVISEPAQLKQEWFDFLCLLSKLAVQVC